MTLMHSNQTCLDLFQCKWLDQVVIRPTLETLQLIFKHISRGQHQYRRIEMGLLTKLAAECDPVHPGQTKIKKDAVEWLSDREMESGHAIGRCINTMTPTL